MFAGVSKDSFTFEEIIKFTQGYNITKKIPLRFYKSLQKLRILSIVAM